MQFCHTNRHDEMRKLTAKIIIGSVTIYYCPIESREGRAFGTLRGQGASVGVVVLHFVATVELAKISLEPQKNRLFFDRPPPA